MLGGGTIELVKQGLFAIGGAVGTRALTSVALGANNVGWIGIGANGAMAWLLGFIISKVVKGNAGKAVVLGGVIGTLLRIVEENTPVGAYVKQQLAGMGVYGDATFYVPLAETVNQQSRDSGNLAQPGVVQSIAAAAAARSAPAKAGMADGGGRYSSGGRYS